MRIGASWLRAMASALVWSTACSVVVDPDVGAGIGATCSTDDECQASTCEGGICAIRCNDTAGCPGGAVCANELCQLPLTVAFVHAGDPASDELTRSFEDGRTTSDAELGYVTSSATLSKSLVGDAVAAASDLADAGASAIVSTLPDPGASFSGFGDAHPGTTVFAFRSAVTEPGVVRFDARTYQAYYLAGIAAARVSTADRLGIVASVPMPEVVACVNAFALGAQRAKGDAVTIDVRWLGQFQDPSPPGPDTQERLLARELEAAGADVVAHVLGDERVLDEVVALRGSGSSVRGVGANVESACNAFPPGTCVGSTYYRWAPLLVELEDRLHKATLDAPAYTAGLAPSVADSVVGFTVDPAEPTLSALAQEIDQVRTELASEPGVGPVFDGPLRSTGQCPGETPTEPCVGDGERLSDEALSSMCWLVEGVVGAGDQPALVPSGGPCGS
jgi:simple sugar transport system substrate-binding protein